MYIIYIIIILKIICNTYTIFAIYYIRILYCIYKNLKLYRYKRNKELQYILLI